MAQRAALSSTLYKEFIRLKFYKRPGRTAETRKLVLLSLVFVILLFERTHTYKIKDAVEIPSTSLTEREEGREKSAEGEG